MQQNTWTRWAIRTGIAAGLFLTLAAAYLVREALSPFLIGLVLAYLLNPAVDFLERRGIARPWGVVLLSLLFFGALAIALALVVPVIHREVSHLIQRLPAYADAFQRDIMPRLEHWLGIRFSGQLREVAERIQALIPNIPQYAFKLLLNIFSSTYNILVSLLSLVIVPVFAFYLLVDFPKLKAAVQAYIPPLHLEATLRWAGHVDQIISSFVRGQLSVALILGILNSIGLLIVGVDFAILIGLFSGLANIIPYMSIIVGVVPAMLLAFLEFRDLVHVAGALGVFILTQTLEGFVISPWIIGESLRLHPVTIMVAVLVGGQVAGLLGLILAVPVAAILSLFIREVLDRYRRSAAFQN